MISNASRLSDTVRLPAEDGAAGLHEPKLGRDPPRLKLGVVLVAGPRDRRLARGGNQNQRWHGVAVRPGPATDIAVPPGLLIFVVNLRGRHRHQIRSSVCPGRLVGATGRRERVTGVAGGGRINHRRVRRLALFLCVIDLGKVLPAKPKSKLGVVQ